MRVIDGLELLLGVLGQPSMPRLRLLSLHTKDARGPDRFLKPFTSLWAAPWFSQLQELSLTADQGFGSAGLAPLREAPLLRMLSIQMVGNAPALAAGDGRALASMPLPSLKRLGLTQVDAGFLATCTAAAWLSRLERLSLRAVGYLGGSGDGEGTLDGPWAWAATPSPRSPEAPRFAALVATPWFGRLQKLDLHCPLGTYGGSDGAGLRALAAALLPNLTLLSLSDVSMLAADVSGVLSSAPWLATSQACGS